MNAALWLLPPLGAFIGFVTNVIAIRMLFYPREPVNIPFTPWTVQGVLPRRHAELAAGIGRTVARDLLSVPELLERLDVTEVKEELAASVGDYVERRLEGGLSKFLPSGWRESVVSYLKSLVAREADALLDDIVDEFSRRAGDRLDVEGLVTEKVMQLPPDELEALIVRLAGRELRTVVALGGVFGFVVGVLQAAVVAVFA